MNKKDLIALVADKANLTRGDAARAVEATLDAITESLTDGEKVRFVGFGTFSVVQRGERRRRDPRTGAPIVVPESRSPKFTAGKKLKKDVLTAA